MTGRIYRWLACLFGLARAGQWDAVRFMAAHPVRAAELVELGAQRARRDAVPPAPSSGALPTEDLN